MAYYLMLNRRDEWGAMHTYRYGKAYKDMKAAITLCKKHLDSFLVNDKNICVFINTSQTRATSLSSGESGALAKRMIKPLSNLSPLSDDSSVFL